ncbi:MAG: alpha-mannosidase [Candidatus Omnitrophica bacterium COP1]|nr:alpha-mannosidase [Candidatus Omnitrophica bacterium COP1]
MVETKKPVVHLIGHGHIDPVWGWRWMEGCEEVRATFRSAIQLMKEFPEYKFTASSAAFYAWVEDLEPELFKEIQEAVREGRWEIAGGWWIEPDCNIPHGESFVRQGLYGQRYFREKFGVQAGIGFNPDSFGHAGVLPQILRKQGMQAYCYLRPNAGHGEMEYPEGKGTVFHWKAKDGSSLIAANIPWSYGSWQWDLFLDIERHTSWAWLLPDQTDLLSFYGIGNHGGGPSRANLHSIREAKERFPHLELRHSSLTDFFTSIERNMGEDLPVIDHDLQFHAVGCYSVVSEVKRLNRAAEHALLSAERFATIESLIFNSPPATLRFERLWKEVLFNQFHDILAGSSIQKAYEDCRNSFGQVLHEALSLEDHARQKLAASIDTSAEGRSLVVFNPSPWPRSEWVIASRDRFFEFRSQGPELPIQVLDEESIPVAHTHCLGEFPGQRAVGFMASVPALGYRTYRVHEVTDGPVPQVEEGVCCQDNLVENDFWRIEICRSRGVIASLFDKKNQVQVLSEGLAFKVLSDSSDTWSHGIRGYRSETGSFGGATVRPVEVSALRSVLRIESHWGASHQDTWLTLYRDVPTIDVRTRLHWNEAFTLLKLAFTTCFEGGICTSESAYGFEEHPTGHYQEYPCQGWIDMTGVARDRSGRKQQYGFALLNDGFHGFDTCDKSLRLTILRSPAYRHHDPDALSESEGWAFTGQGVHEFRLRLVPHAGGWRTASVPRLAWELNEPLYLHQESSHPGSLPGSASFLCVDHPRVAASVLKHHEDKPECVAVRLYETTGQSAEAEVAFPWFKASWKVSLGPCEIKTLQVDLGTHEIREVNLLEDE